MNGFVVKSTRGAMYGCCGVINGIKSIHVLIARATQK